MVVTTAQTYSILNKKHHHIATAHSQTDSGAMADPIESIGLDYVVEHREYVHKLAEALGTRNAALKKRVFELLAALSAHNADGHERALETLEHYKKLKKSRYRLEFVISELEKSPTVEYQLTLLSFINCVIMSAGCLQDQIRLRNEFIGLNLVNVLNNLRRNASATPELIEQLDVFDRQRECDEAQSLQMPEGINLNLHLDVFYAILRQVTDTPQAIPFLSILQHLLRIDPKEPISDIIWDTAENLVHRATLLETRDDRTRLLRSTSVQKIITCPHCRGDLGSSAVPGSTSRRQSVAPPPVNIASPPPPPPPPLPSSAFGPPPPPPPPFAFPDGGAVGFGGSSAPPPPPLPSHMQSGAPPPAPPPPLHKHASSQFGAQPPPPAGRLHKQQTAPAMADEPPLPQQATPKPKSKMKTINWNKIHPNKVLGRHNLWTMLATSHAGSPKDDLDWGEMEEMFCLNSNSNPNGSAGGLPANGPTAAGRSRGDSVDGSGSGATPTGSPGASGDQRARRDNAEITLLDGKRCLNVNIFLKQFRASNNDIIQLIKDGEHEDIGAEKLRGFLKILPEVDEIDMLRNFEGDVNRLGKAEQFLLQLMQLSNYKLRIESMLLKEEFAANMDDLGQSINAMIRAGHDLTSNKLLQEVLYIVLVAGNFLNAGGYAGNAVGVKLSSLQKLTDIRANKPGMTLIHYVAMQAEKKNPELLTFPDAFTTLENASKITVEQIISEINVMEKRIHRIKDAVALPHMDPDIKAQMTQFLQAAEIESYQVQLHLKEIDALRLQLAEFYCDDPATFKLEECFKVFQVFCDRFKAAAAENVRRRVQEEQSTLRRKLREEQQARKARLSSMAGTPVSDSDTSLMDASMLELRNSPAMSRRRKGSFSSAYGGGDPNLVREDTASPDITPNGSLRRRRSRTGLVDEDDEKLMEFLRSSGNDDGSRERKPSSYGSLDRSWSRKMRTGTASKKRPDLLNIDFGADRERTSSPSPSPLSEVKALPTEEKPRELRHKIESWLEANKQDEKDDQRTRGRRLVAARKSFENESESERSKLDPLPEERVSPSADHHTTTPSYRRVYADWKPTASLPNADIVDTIEAVADLQPSSAVDSETYSRRLQRQRSREAIEAVLAAANTSKSIAGSTAAAPLSSPLRAIIEEDRNRKSILQQLAEEPPVVDRLQIYIRRPSDAVTVLTELHPAGEPIKSPLAKLFPPFQASGNKNTPAPVSPLSLASHANSNTIEVDSDNIETPPTTRRRLAASASTTPSETTIPTSALFQPSIARTPSKPTPCRKLQTPRPLHRKTIEENSRNEQLNGKTPHSASRDDPEQPQELNDEALMGDGQFDRRSSTRKTLRYRRPTDHSSGAEDQQYGGSSASSQQSSPGASEPPPPAHKAIIPDTPIRQPTMPSPTLPKNVREPPEAPKTAASHHNGTAKRIIARIGKIGRNLSSINQEDVCEAKRNLKSPTDTPDRIWSPPRELHPPASSGHIQLQRSALNAALAAKTAQLELNCDEGFEETQSLVSDTASHGKESSLSSCNESTVMQPATPSPAKNSAASSSTATARNASAPRKTLLSRSGSSAASRSLDRSGSSRSPAATTSASATATTGGHRRTLSTRSAAVSSSTAYHGVETPPSSVPANPSRSASSSNQRTTRYPTSTVPSVAAGNHDVERSSSRTSLRSSRSSLNSSASAVTVKNVAAQRSALEKSIYKRPALSQNMPPSLSSSPSHSFGGRPASNASPTTTNAASSAMLLSASAPPSPHKSASATGGSGGRMPASRSSSSGSSIGATIARRPFAASSTVSTLRTPLASRRDASTAQSSASSRVSPAPRSSSAAATAQNIHGSSPAATTNRLNSAAAKITARLSGGPSTTDGKSSNSSGRPLSSFMRPTTASSTKFGVGGKTK